MDQGIALGHSEKIFRHRFRYIGRIPLHRIGLRIMPLQEDLQLMNAYEICRVSNYRSKESTIALVAAELTGTILLTCDIDGIQWYGIPLYCHKGLDLQLPAGVRQGCRHGHIEADGDIARPLRHITEACCNLRGIYHISSHHLSSLGIPYRIHYQGLVHQSTTYTVYTDLNILLSLHRRLIRHGERQRDGA